MYVLKESCITSVVDALGLRRGIAGCRWLTTCCLRRVLK